MTADQLIQNAKDTANRLYEDDPNGAAKYEAEMLRRYIREVWREKESLKAARDKK